MTAVLSSACLVMLLLTGPAGAETPAPTPTPSATADSAAFNRAWDVLSAADDALDAASATAAEAQRQASAAGAAYADATSLEARLLSEQGWADAQISNMAREMYMQGDAVNYSLIADIITKGPSALNDAAALRQYLDAAYYSKNRKALQVKARAAAARAASSDAQRAYALTSQRLSDASAALAAAQQASDAAHAQFSTVLTADSGVFSGSLTSAFSDGEAQIPGAQDAVARALGFVGNAADACSDGHCYRLCDHLAGKIWGYESSGYDTARVHWFEMVAGGHAHPGDTRPPVGALLFWDTGIYGHVAVYVGKGLIVTNASGANGSNVYLLPASDISEKWGAPYWGWSDPVFAGPRL